MLSEEVRQLLASYVDGAVSARQRKQVDRLLRKSAEARELLEQLQRDSGELRAMRRQKLPQDFSLQVLRSIAEKQLKPAPPPPQPKPFPAWIGASVAAAVLVAVTGASFLFFSSLQRGPLTQREQADLAPKPLFTLPNLDLSAEETRTLGEQLAKEEAPRFNLECNDPAKAVERLESALRETGIQLVVPESARRALSQEAKVAYLLFAENVTASELAALLYKMGRDDRRERQMGRRGAGFGRLLVHAVTQQDRRELSLLLGINDKDLRPGALGQKLDLKVPIQSVPGSVGDKGDAPGIPVPPQDGTPPERYALVLARADGAGDVASSPEVRSFLMRRSAGRPGTLQVIVEIQPALG
jgi:hypothetical protein